MKQKPLPVSFIGDRRKWVSFINLLQGRGCEVTPVKDIEPFLRGEWEEKPAMVAVDFSQSEEEKFKIVERLIAQSDRLYVIALVNEGNAHLVPSLFKKGIPDIIREPVDAEQTDFIIAKSIISRDLEDPNFVYLFPTDGTRISKRKLARDSLEKIITRFSLEEVISMKLRNLLERRDLEKAGNFYNIITGEFEKVLFKLVLEKTEGNILQAARILGINRNTLSKKIQKYNIKS